MTLAIFDLDDTLISDDSDHAWGEFVADKGLVDPDEHRRANDAFFADYKNGTLDINAYLRFACKVLAMYDMPRLAEIREAFFEERIRPLLLPRAFDLVEKHRAAGDTLLVVTATIEFVTAPIVQHLGIEHLIAPIPEIRDNRYTGGIVGTPSFREGKVKRIREWLASTGESLEGSYAYSDSHNDLPMLELASYPTAVDPDATLREEANRRGWPVISLRQQVK